MASDPRKDIGVNPNPQPGLGTISNLGDRNRFLAQQQQAAANIRAAASAAGQNISALYQSTLAFNQMASHPQSYTSATTGYPAGGSTVGGSGVSALLGAASSGVGGLSGQGQMTSNPIINQALNAAGLNSGDPQVYVGGDGSYAPKYQSLSSLATQWYTMDQSSKDQFEAQLGLAGYKIESMSDSDLANLWGAYIGQAAAYTANGHDMTLWDVLAQDQKRHQNLVNTVKPTTITRTDRQVQKSTYEDAHALFMTAAQSLLGRAPTAKETREFQAALNAKEAANPTITRTTQTTDAAGNVSTSSSSSGGFSAQAAQDLAQQQAQNTPGYAEYQAATNYFNDLLGAIGHI